MPMVLGCAVLWLKPVAGCWPAALRRSHPATNDVNSQSSGSCTDKRRVAMTRLAGGGASAATR